MTENLLRRARALGAVARDALTRPRRGEVDVDGRWFVITGCDTGIGRGVAEAMVKRGGRVVGCCFTEEGARELAAMGAAAAPRFDLADETAVDEAAKTMLDRSGGAIAGVVHNAGVVLPGFVDYLPPDVYRRVMEVNFFAPVRLTQLLLPALRAARGRAVFVSSVDGLVSLPGNAPYDASKFAIEAYADALRVELSFWGVDVSVVNPSTLRTPLALSFFDRHLDAWDEMKRLDPDGEWTTHYSREWVEAYVSTNRARLDRIAEEPHHAIDDIVRALTARTPRHRYLSGTLARTVFRALWVMPERWSTGLKRRMVTPIPRTGTAPRRPK